MAEMNLSVCVFAAAAVNFRQLNLLSHALNIKNLEYSKSRILEGNTTAVHKFAMSSKGHHMQACVISGL